MAWLKHAVILPRSKEPGRKEVADVKSEMSFLKVSLKLISKLNWLNVGRPTLDDFDIMSEFRGSPLDADVPELARFEQIADKKVHLTSLNIYWQSFKDEVMEKMKKFGLGQKPRKF